MAGVKGMSKGHTNRNKKGIKTAQSSKGREKSALTRSVTTPRRLTPEVQKYIKDSLTEPDRNGKSFYEKFIQRFLDEALSDPNSKAGCTLASSMFSETLLDKLDQEANKAMAKDQDFLKYRIRSTLFAKQQEVFDNQVDETIEIICGRQSGKSQLNARILVASCADPGTPCLYVNLTFTNAISQLYQLCVDLSDEYGLGIKRQSSSDGYIEYSNGSSIKFRGNANKAEADKCRGFQNKVIIIDEVGHQNNLNYLVYEAITPTTIIFAHPKFIFTGTPPRAPHHFSENLWNNPNTKRYSWTFRDNPYAANKDQIIPRAAKLAGVSEDSTFIQREYLGIMGAYDRESQVYKGFQIFTELPSENFIPTNIYIGVDWGGVDNNAVAVLIASKYSKNGFVALEFKKNNMSVTEICNQIIHMRLQAIEIARRLNRDFDESRTQVICDNNELDNLWELSKEYHVPNVCKAYKVDKMFAIQQLAELSRTGVIKILKDGIVQDEFEQILYKRDKETDVILNEIDEDLFHGDIEAALRYASRNFCVEILGSDENNKPAKAINPTVNPVFNPINPKQNSSDSGLFEDVNWD